MKVAFGDAIMVLSGGGGVIGIVFLALFITGHIVPKSRVEELKADHDAAMAAIREERDEWKQVAALNAQRAEVGVLTGHIVKDVMQALRKEIQP